MYTDTGVSGSGSSASSDATVQRHRVRSFSTSSLSSVGSFLSRRQCPDAAPKSSSSLSLTLLATCRGNSSSAFLPGLRTESSPAPECKALRLVEVAESAHETSVEAEDAFTLQAIDTEAGSEAELEEQPSKPSADTASFDEVPASPEPQAFRRWVSTLRRKRLQKPAPVTPRKQRWALDDFEIKQPSSPKQRPLRHQRNASNTSSMGFVTAVKSATATLASASIATVSRRNSKLRRARQHSSLFSGCDPRPSVDTQRSIVDEAARQRSRKRREKVEELIRTEEGYVADLKALSNALYTLLGYQKDSQSCARNRASITLSHLIALHHDILGQLHEMVPFAEREREQPRPTRAHTRWHSVDGALPTRKTTKTFRHGRLSLNLNRSSDEEGGLQFLCEPKVMAAVAGIFGERIAQFSAYEQFGGYYEFVRADVDQTQQSIASWPEYDSAIETLAYAINPVQSRDANRRKALTVKDLLIKPIQRLPRYELLFNELCELTPVCDGPDCHAALERVLQDINQACCLMDKAKDNDSSLRALETTCLIGERLTFSSQVPRSVFLQLLGQVVLCGCLHVAYRGKDRIKGSYVICVLFETTLLLASAPDEQQRYSTIAGIALANATIAECDNLKGLQCYTAPHSWKLVFEHAARMYEMVFTACSAPEKDAWLQRIADKVGAQSQAVAEGAANIFELHSPIVAEMRSIGKAFGKPGSFVRRMSVRRTATVGPMTDLNQVIIKNTQAVKETLENSSTASLPIERSQTVATPSHVQTLAPRRADRVRLEALLSDVWTKDSLPYPGMTARRTDPIRASANHVMRKFSMASIASNFSTAKRNASYTSINYPRSKEDIPPSESSRAGERRRRKHTRPPLVDFHNAPEAFLPEDFDLQDPAKRKRSAFRTFTLTMERPFSPLLCESKPTSLRRTQSVRDVLAESEESAETEIGMAPVYSVVQERAEEVQAKTPRKAKSRNRLLRMFG